MPRIARIVVTGYPHHITQRGNYKQITFTKRADYLRYLKWLERCRDKYELDVIAYCLMPNHVHFAAIPRKEYSLARTFNACHMRYSQYFNGKDNRTGHLWQGRFYSCVLDENHLYSVVRYIENNPVRKGLVKKAEDWEWSSARGHLNKDNSVVSLTSAGEVMNVDNWGEYLNENGDKTITAKIRRHTLAGRPLGDENFVLKLEKLFDMRLRVLPAGRPKNKQ